MRRDIFQHQGHFRDDQRNDRPRQQHRQAILAQSNSRRGCRHNGNGTLFVRLQGRLVGPYAEDARMTLARYQVPPTIVADLSEVTFIDALGEEVLLWLGRMGSEFVADNVYARSVCEPLQLHISQKRLAHLSGTKSQVSL